MKLNYSVSFENETTPVDTVRGTVVAGGPGTAANRAIKLAKKQAKTGRWKSIVVVLERGNA